MSYAHMLGISSAIFVDDGKVAGESKQEAEEAMELVFELFRLAGWDLQRKKTSLEAEQKVLYLGVEVDCGKMIYKLLEDKSADVEQVLDRKINRGEESTKREAAYLLGKLTACRLMHGAILHIMTRNAQHLRGKTTQLENWERSIIREQRAVE
jgi:hypothetical protein